MNLGSRVNLGAWRLNNHLWTIIIASFTALFVFLSTPWLTLAAIGLLTGTLWMAANFNELKLSTNDLQNWQIVGLIVGCYFLASLAWTGDSRATGITIATFSYLCILLTMAKRSLDVATQEPLEHLTRALVAAYIVALVYMLIEQSTGDLIKRALFRPFLAMRWREGALSFDFDKAVANIPPHRIKWNMPPVVFVLWPMLLMFASQLKHARATSWLQCSIVGAALLLTFLAGHQTSFAALIAAIFVFSISSLANVRSASVSKFLMGAWIAGFLFIVPLALVSYRMDLHLSNRIGASMAARLILWNFTAEQIPKHPILGVGAAATRLLDNELNKIDPAPTPTGYNYALRTGPHAHNIFLQSWYELGVLGTALFGLFGLIVLATALRAPASSQPYLFATEATVVFSVSGSFGLFEPWYMGTIAMAVATALIAVRYDAICPRKP